VPLFPDFHRAYSAEEPVSYESIVWLLFRANAVLVSNEAGAIHLPHTPDLAPPIDVAEEPLPLGRIDGHRYMAAEAADAAALPEGWTTAELRSLYGRIPDAEWPIAGYAAQVLHWRRTSGFCPICGSVMGLMGLEWRRTCTGCGQERYPMVSPAVLALVHDGDRILLAHKPGWGARRSILAGFTLPGESLEECVHREVLEEAGVRVDGLAYFGSQPWPFPHQLMIGFFSRYVAGTIEIDTEELEGAEWYDYRELPPLPPPLSLSRQLIDAWARSRGAGASQN
jgi:NAD+ diphosphatase